MGAGVHLNSGFFVVLVVDGGLVDGFLVLNIFGFCFLVLMKFGFMLT